MFSAGVKLRDATYLRATERRRSQRRTLSTLQNIFLSTKKQHNTRSTHKQEDKPPTELQRNREPGAKRKENAADNKSKDIHRLVTAGLGTRPVSSGT